MTTPISSTSSVPIITIDGPSGSGKGTLAAKLAAYYGYHLLDSGALYRLLGLSLSHRDLMTQLESEAVRQVAEQLDIEFTATADGVRVRLDGEDVSTVIRTEQVGSLASQVAAIPQLRQALLQRQRDFAQLPGLVADGRDMGTLIFPNAQAKIFLTASAQSRAERRFKQLQKVDDAVKIHAILADLQARDARDTQRSIAPLIPAADALIIDSSDLTIEQVFSQMQAFITQRLPSLSVQ